MYSLLSFNLANYEIKFEEVFTNGEFIDWYGNIALYSYGDFYVEVVYLIQSNKISSILGISIDQAYDYEVLTDFF